ncbi:hypothetical protein ERJ75_000896500 [Trypanosoma vivax]|nr:hypothetical protein ERJ75_000896500 [Trypanosoma vivax]
MHGRRCDRQGRAFLQASMEDVLTVCRVAVAEKGVKEAVLGAGAAGQAASGLRELPDKAEDPASLAQGHSWRVVRTASLMAYKAGRIDEWICMGASLASKGASGAFCLGDASTPSSSLQSQLSSTLIGKDDDMAGGGSSGGNANKLKAPASCQEDITADKANTTWEQTATAIGAAFGHNGILKKFDIASAGAGAAAGCPLLSIVAAAGAGIYREHTMTCTWKLSTDGTKLSGTVRTQEWTELQT